MDFNKYFDHTLLKPEATAQDIKTICKEAIRYGFASVCVNPCYVAKAKEMLRGTDVKVCTVVGFPLGASETEVKVFEAQTAIERGADEIDMVLSVGALKDGDDAMVQEEIRRIKAVCEGRILKVIIETCLLSREEKIRACRLCVAAGADYIKTSTGFSTGGATKEDVRLMKQEAAGRAKIKAAGGIRDLEGARRMIEAGADRIGTSRTVAIVKEAAQSR